MNAGVELLPSRTRDAIREAQRTGGTYRDAAVAIVAGDRRRLQVLDTPIEEGSIGCAIDVSELEKARDDLKRLAEDERPHARPADGRRRGVRQERRAALLQ